MDIDAATNEKLKAVAVEQPYPLLFVTVSGAHLYGFASGDSDYDLRGVHVLPPAYVMGLAKPRETIEVSRPPAGPGDIDLDLVTHDVKKFMLMMLRRNGYVLEQLLSPLIVHTTDAHAELKAAAAGCITKHHSHHYIGFARNQWDLFRKGQPRRVKPLLYVYRAVLTGLHLMNTGEIEANLPALNEEFALPYIDDLIAQKVNGREKEPLDAADLTFHEQEYERLSTELVQSVLTTPLPEAPTARDELNDILLRVRTQTEQP